MKYPPTGPAPVRPANLLNERQTKVIHLREVEHKSYAKIGEAIGVGTQRALDVYREAKRVQERSTEPDEFYGLRRRITYRFIDLGLHTREQVADAVRSGRLLPGKVRHYGWTSHGEVRKWLGFPALMAKSTRCTVCPNCGHNLLGEAP